MSGRGESIRIRNERVALAARRHHFGDEIAVPFLCECEDDGCDAFVLLTLPEHDRARRDRAQVVAPGHAAAPHERARRPAA